MVYIVLFKDQTLQLFVSKVEYSHFEKGAKIFTVPNHLAIVNVCKWIGNNYKHSEIREVKR